MDRMIITKKCAVCKKEKEVKDFYSQYKYKHLYTPECMKCFGVKYKLHHQRLKAKKNVIKIKIANLNSKINFSKGKNGWVYFIQDTFTGCIKIGWGINPYARVNQLQTGSAGVLQLLGAFSGTTEDEKRIHVLMKKEHFRGEWFNNDISILQYINERNTYLR